MIKCHLGIMALLYPKWHFLFYKRNSKPAKWKYGAMAGLHSHVYQRHHPSMPVRGLEGILCFGRGRPKRCWSHAAITYGDLPRSIEEDRRKRITTAHSVGCRSPPFNIWIDHQNQKLKGRLLWFLKNPDLQVGHNRVGSGVFTLWELLETSLLGNQKHHFRYL